MRFGDNAFFGRLSKHFEGLCVSIHEIATILNANTQMPSWFYPLSARESSSEHGRFELYERICEGTVY